MFLTKLFFVNVFDATFFWYIFDKTFFFTFLRKLFFLTSFGEKSFGELHLAKLHLALPSDWLRQSIPFARFYTGYASDIDFLKRLDRQTHKQTLAQLYYR